MYGTESKCLCPPDFRGDLCEKERVELECHANMSVWFYPIAPFEGIVHFGNNVTDPDCRLTRNSSDEFYGGLFSLDDSCGGFVINETDQLIYKKELNIQYSPDFVNVQDIVFNLSCIHNKDNTQLSFGTFQTEIDKPGAKDKTVVEEKEEVYEPAKLSILDADMGAITGPVTLGQKAVMYNFLGDSKIYKNIYVGKCSVIDPDNGVTVTMLDNGCPAESFQKQFYTDAKRTTSPNIGITHGIKIFKLRPNTKRMQFSCEVTMCRDNSDSECNLATCGASRIKREVSRAKRDTTLIKRKYQNTTFEIYIKTSPGDSDDDIIGVEPSEHSDNNLPIIYVSGASFLVIAVLLTAIFVILKKRSIQGRKAAGLPGNLQADPKLWNDIAIARHDQLKI